MVASLTSYISCETTLLAAEEENLFQVTVALQVLQLQSALTNWFCRLLGKLRLASIALSFSWHSYQACIGKVGMRGLVLQEALLNADAEMVYKSIKPSTDSNEAASSQHPAPVADVQSDDNATASALRMQASDTDTQADGNEVASQQDAASHLEQSAGAKQPADVDDTGWEMNMLARHDLDCQV